MVSKFFSEGGGFDPAAFIVNKGGGGIAELTGELTVLKTNKEMLFAEAGSLSLDAGKNFDNVGGGYQVTGLTFARSRLMLSYSF